MQSSMVSLLRLAQKSPHCLTSQKNSWFDSTPRQRYRKRLCSSTSRHLINVKRSIGESLGERKRCTSDLLPRDAISFAACIQLARGGVLCLRLGLEASFEEHGRRPNGANL